MTTFHRIARSNHPGLQVLKNARLAILNLSLPAPRVLTLPMRWTYVKVRAIYWFLLRVLVCEPIFKSYCKQVGRNVHTDIHVPFVTGQGDIVAGDDVLIDGYVSIKFAARFSDCPRFAIGD